MNGIDCTARRIINTLQTGFPLSHRPFADAALGLELDESTLIHYLKSLLTAGFLSRFGPLFNAEKIGGALTLAAMSVPEHAFDTVAAQVNAMPEVAHNYAREHALNMWFVLATERPEEINSVIDKIEKSCGYPVFNMPKLEEFCLGFQVHMAQAGEIDTWPMPRSTTNNDTVKNPTKERTLSHEERLIVTATQEGLPLTPRPYDALAESLGMTTGQVIRHLDIMRQHGWIRRIGVVPNHYRLGLKGNGMSVWNLPDDKIFLLGNKIGSLGFISHCYHRPRCLPEWPFNLFAMVHGRDRSVVEQRVETMAKLLGNDNRGHAVLYSSRILKKSGLRLKSKHFSPRPLHL